MEKTLKEIAELVGGEVVGDGEVLITGVAPMESATSGDISFISSPKYADQVKSSAASAVIVSPDLKIEGKNLLITKNPQLAFAKLLTIFTSKPYLPRGVDNRAFIGKNPTIGRDVTIYPFVYIGDNVKIGDRTVIHPGAYIGDGSSLGEDTVIYPNAAIMKYCTIGNRVIVHPGVVIGSDGFGYARDGKQHYKIPQVGIVQIDDDVEIGANTTIDRAAFDKTHIKRGTKIDNLVQIAHNVVIGEDSIIIAQVGIAGSSRVGSNVILAGQVGLADHITIGDNVMVGAQSGVASSIDGNQIVSGSPAIPHKDWLKASMTFSHLPEMRKTIKELQKKIEELEAKVKS